MNHIPTDVILPEQSTESIRSSYNIKKKQPKETSLGLLTRTKELDTTDLRAEVEMTNTNGQEEDPSRLIDLSENAEEPIAVSDVDEKKKSKRKATKKKDTESEQLLPQDDQIVSISEDFTAKDLRSEVDANWSIATNEIAIKTIRPTIPVDTESNIKEATNDDHRTLNTIDQTPETATNELVSINTNDQQHQNTRRLPSEDEKLSVKEVEANIKFDAKPSFQFVENNLSAKEKENVVQTVSIRPTDQHQTLILEKTFDLTNIPLEIVQPDIEKTSSIEEEDDQSKAKKRLKPKPETAEPMKGNEIAVQNDANLMFDENAETVTVNWTHDSREKQKKSANIKVTKRSEDVTKTEVDPVVESITEMTPKTNGHLLPNENTDGKKRKKVSNSISDSAINQEKANEVDKTVELTARPLQVDANANLKMENKENVVIELSGRKLIDEQKKEIPAVNYTSINVPIDLPTFDNEMQETVEFDAKDELRLRCRFTCSTIPELTTTINGTPLNSEVFATTINANEIVLVKPNASKLDGGVFCITIKTQFGEATKKIDVVVHDVPDAPESLRIVEFGVNFVKLEWEKPISDGGSPIKFYRIEMKQQNRRAFKRAGQVDGTERSFVIADLDENTTYEFRVAGINKFGTGDFTGTELTTENQFTAPVISVPPRVKEFSEKLCVLEWDDCEEDGNSPVYSYDVYVQEDDGEPIKVNTEDVFCTKFAVKDRIKPGHSYAFKIEARNEAGLVSHSDIFTEPRFCSTTTEYSDTVLSAPVVSLSSIDSVSVRALDLPETVEYSVFFKSESNNKWEELKTDDATIVIPNLKHGLSYTFKIEAKTADGLIHRSEETDPILIGDDKKPRIIKEIRDVEVAEKKRLQLECHALGESISFTWTKDEVDLYAETSVMICNEGHSSVLTIENVRPSDAGVYKCKIANSHAEVETKAKVVVADVDAYFESTFPESIAVVEGETLRLKCTVSDPDAKVTFRKNGQPISSDDSNIKILVDETTRELVLDNVNADNQGEYVCLLSDGQKAKCKVSVNEPEVHVLVGPQDQIVTTHNQNIALTCHLTRNAAVEWFKNGSQLSLQSLEAKYKVVSENTKSILKINNFNERDIGDYSCRLANGEESAPATVELQVEPQIDFLSDAEKVEINVGSDLKMTFNLNGYPIPQIEGELNGISFADLSFSQTSEDGKTTIKIRSIEREHAGTLTIRAVNSFGVDEKSIQLRVKDVPASPRKVEVKLMETNGAEVTWSTADSDDQPVSSYVVERQSGMFNRWRQCGVVMADQPLRLLVEELPWDEIVSFRVVSQNEIGRSKPSTIVDVTTKSGSESDESETNSTATAINPQVDQPFEAPILTRVNDGVQLTWKAIEKVKLYAIERRKAGEKTWMKIGQTSHTSFVDRTITSPTGCSYRVVANFENSTMKVSVPATDQNPFEATEDVEETSTVNARDDYASTKNLNNHLNAEEKKTSIDNVPKDDIVKLPEDSSTSILLKEKDVTASKSRDDNNVDDEISSIDLSEKSESKRKVEEANEVEDARLVESNEVPQSTATNQNEKTVKSIDATVPIKISSLEVVQVNNDSVQLQWAAAIHRPSFKGFVVEKYSNSFGKWQCVAKCTEPTTNIGGLSRTETYKFRVASESTNGIMSDFVEAAPVHLTVRNKRTNKPKEDKKSPEITDLEVLSTDNDSVELVWVTESSGQPRTFIVEGCRMDDGEEGEWIPMSRTTDERAKICDLDENVDYRFRVWTEDSMGKRSEASISKLVHVPGRRQIETVPLKLVQPLIDVDVESGDDEDVVLSCRFANIPTDALVTWFKDGRPISTAGRRKFASEIDASGVAILRIRDPTNSDIGAYKCTIARDDVEQSSESQLNVRPRIANERLDVNESTNVEDRQKRPVEEDEFVRRRSRKRLIEEDDEQIEPLRFLHKLHDDEVTTGDSATFSIAYHSAVVPEIEWYHNGNRVIGLPGRFRLSNDYGRSMFTIESTTVDCAGEWMVLARTPTGEFRSQCTLKVNERRSTTLPSKPSSFEHRDDVAHKLVVDQKSDEESTADRKQQREVSAIEEDQSILLSKKKSDELEETQISKRSRVRREDKEIETGSPPVFHHLLSDLNARVGERVVLSVTSTTTPEPTVSWMRNGTPIKRTDADYVVRSDCDRTREEAPEFGFELHDVQCQVGSMLILEASVRSRPEASISWWKDGNEIAVGREFRMIGDGRIQSLSVLDALLVHSGEYEIRAENIHGMATSKCVVTVNDPVHDQFSVTETRAPVVRLPLTPIRELPEGSEVHLVCTIISTSTTPRIEWLKDQLPINFPAVFRFHHGVAELIIERAECHHSGVFTVIASNAYGTCRSTGVLYVQPSTDTKTGPPKFVELLTNSTLVAGQELVLECQVSTNPLPTIKWWKDGFQILSDPRLLLYTDRRGVARLNLMDCKVSDSGEYSCEAISSFGRDFTHSQVKIVAEVEEEERRRIGGELPVIIRHLSDCYIHYGNQKILEAEIRSFTSTSIEFLYNGRPLAETRTLRTYFDGNRLALIKIFDAEHAHSGEYEIVFTNRYGQASSRASVVVENPETEGYVPSMPVFVHPLQSVKLTAIGETVEFRCVVKGQPQPNVQFLQNGKAVTEENDGNVTITSNENEHLLRINSSTTSWIGSQITAAASNIFGLVHSNAEITIETDKK
ncbi:Immunoglobulin I-set domain protein [Aphelenchoides besseyi]|nr:Immunoglobulin I-set domain protein [Aphelenchoides besseyi]